MAGWLIYTHVGGYGFISRYARAIFFLGFWCFGEQAPLPRTRVPPSVPFLGHHAFPARCTLIMFPWRGVGPPRLPPRPQPSHPHGGCVSWPLGGTSLACMFFSFPAGTGMGGRGGAPPARVAAATEAAATAPPTTTLAATAPPPMAVTTNAAGVVAAVTAVAVAVVADAAVVAVVAVTRSVRSVRSARSWSQSSARWASVEALLLLRSARQSPPPQPVSACERGERQATAKAHARRGFFVWVVRSVCRRGGRLSKVPCLVHERVRHVGDRDLGTLSRVLLQLSIPHITGSKVCTRIVRAPPPHCIAL